tara:strand:+ start:275 stop:481 length:207 start_codon:yes stop_codon:yes gene_type:complete
MITEAFRRKVAEHLSSAHDGDDIPSDILEYFDSLTDEPGFPFWGEDMTWESGVRVFLWDLYREQGVPA